MPPTAPYCSTPHVYVLRVYIEGVGKEDFNDDLRRAVEQWIGQIAARMDAAYYGAGYAIPFETVSGETWPDWQTFFLQYMNAVGVASMLGADASQTQIYNLAAGERSSRSRHQIEWETLIGGIEEKVTQKRIAAPSLVSAATRSGSNAEYLLSSPTPPLMSSLLGYNNPRMTDNLREMTWRQIFYSEEITKGNPPDASNPYSLDFLSELKTELGL
jgi:hypothetical protein